MENTPFHSAGHIRHAQESMQAQNDLEKLGTCWIGPDISVEKTRVVQPGEFAQDIKILLEKEDLPPDVNLTRGALDSLSLSVRSFFAQTGINVRFHSDFIDETDLKKLQNGEKVAVPVEVNNFGQRAVELNGRLFRFFWVDDRKRLRGEKLLKAVKNGAIKIEGVEGEDWFLGGHEPEDKFTTNAPGSDQGLCVVVRLKPERFYIPPDAEPIKRDESLNIRDQLANYLKPIPPGANFTFEIGETPKIMLDERFMAVINTGANEHREMHINSPLMDGGRSNWPIRTEIIQRYARQQEFFVSHPVYLDFFLYQK